MAKAKAKPAAKKPAAKKPAAKAKPAAAAVDGGAESVAWAAARGLATAGKVRWNVRVALDVKDEPASEVYTGTTDSPFGKDRHEPGKEAQAKQLSGRLGDGETLQQSLTSAGDQSKSRRGYKDLYEAMAPAAQDAVQQENIPLGSRFFIKRYFEAIRPRE